MENEVKLDSVDTIGEVAQSISDRMEYPCLLIKGVESQEEVLFIRCHSQGATVLPIYVDFNGYLKRIGYFALTLGNLLILHSIGDYELTLYKSEDNVVKIDLNDPNTIEKFCSIL